MHRSSETHFNLSKKDITNLACFSCQHFSCLEVFIIPLALITFAITLKGINILRG